MRLAQWLCRACRSAADWCGAAAYAPETVIPAQCARQREIASRSGASLSTRAGVAGAPAAERLADWAEAVDAAAINATIIRAGNLIVMIVLLKIDNCDLSGKPTRHSDA
jgi:hypothetical protein